VIVSLACRRIDPADADRPTQEGGARQTLEGTVVFGYAKRLVFYIGESKAGSYLGRSVINDKRVIA
jgi:hypothetical protein